MKKEFEFSRSRDRLDAFFYNIIGQDPEFADLISVVRLVMMLSHGNATVESGFSVNEGMLAEICMKSREWHNEWFTMQCRLQVV